MKATLKDLETAARRDHLMIEADLVRYNAWDRISAPKNVAKGGWDSISTARLFLMLLEEAVELVWEVAVRRDRTKALEEAGDLLTVVSMLTERTHR